jgi:hypothetical protein
MQLYLHRRSMGEPSVEMGPSRRLVPVIYREAESDEPRDNLGGDITGVVGRSMRDEHCAPM